MKLQKIRLLHLILWLLFVLPISCVSIFIFKVNPALIKTIYPGATMDYVIMDACYNLVIFGLSFYLFYFLFFEWLFYQFSRASVVKSIGVFFLLHLIEIGAVSAIYPQELIDSDLILGGSVTLFIWLLFRLGLGLGARALIELINERIKRRELEQFNLQSELSLFRAQVNPHFLFNTLNNIDALIHSNPDQASETLIKLSKQMRYLLYDSNVTQIDLSLEIDFIQNYIDLETIRLSNKKFVVFEMNGNLKGVKIAPMLFIAFIENAFKHCGNKQRDEGLVIRLTRTAEALLFYCENSYDEDRSTTKIKYSGIGLDLVQKRLKLIYGERYQLEINDEKNRYQVALTLPLLTVLPLKPLKQR